jgi:aspartate aminotransferase
MFELVSGIRGVECIEPEGAFYVFPNVTEAIQGRYPSSAALAEALIEEAFVAVIPGESFGAPGHIRLSYALGEEEIARGVERIEALLGS